MCLYCLNKYEDAITWMDNAISIDPKYADSLGNKGRLNHDYINKWMFTNLFLIKLNVRLMKKI